MTKADLRKENLKLKKKIEELTEDKEFAAISLSVHHFIGDELFSKAFTDFFLSVTSIDDGSKHRIHKPALDGEIYDNRYYRKIEAKYAEPLQKLYDAIKALYLRTYKNGKTDGINLLLQLNKGEITLEKLEEEAKTKG